MSNCGRYNKRITFYKQEEVSGYGVRMSQQLKPVKQVWASVKATGGSEMYEIDRLENTVSYDVRTRYIPVLADDTLIIGYNGQRFEIKSVVNVREENTELAFTCVRIMKAGAEHGKSRMEL